MAETQALVIGFREESWPKGWGYLYWRRADDDVETRLLDCNLYDAEDDSVARLFEEAMEKLAKLAPSAAEPGATITLRAENMSAFVREAMVQAFGRRFTVVREND